MLYVVDYNPVKETLEVLDEDDGVVSSISVIDFIIYYKDIRHLIANRFYSPCFGENYNEVLIEKTMDLGCFELYDRNDITKKPALRVLLDKFGITNYRDLCRCANEFNCMFKDLNGVYMSFSFCVSILNDTAFSVYFKYFNSLVDLFNAGYLSGSFFDDYCFELRYLCFCYMRDYLLFHDSNTVGYSMNIFLNSPNVLELIEDNNGYLIKFKSKLYAKFYFFALMYIDGFYSSLNYTAYDIIKILSEPLYEARNELGEIEVDYYSGNCIRFTVENYKPMYWITKNYVLKQRR